MHTLLLVGGFKSLFQSVGSQSLFVFVLQIICLSNMAAFSYSQI